MGRTNMNKDKKIYWKCPRCKKIYRDIVSIENVPIRTKKDKEGQIIVLSSRKVPVCDCGSFLERRREKTELKKMERTTWQEK
jgi:uncharacterized pyridoxamine 5'-phosphate oxidase family protein